MATAKPKFIFRLFRFLSFLVGLAGLFIIAEEILFLQSAQQIKGEVVRVEQDFSSGQRAYLPEIRYSGLNTPVYTSFLDQASPNYNVAVGETVVILFNPQNPRDIRLNEGFNAWMPGGRLAFIGLLGYFILGFATRGSRQKPASKAKMQKHLLNTQPKHAKSADHLGEQNYTPAVTRMR